MEIKLSIKQDDIEQAIKDYVASKGITTPVREINFQVARKGGFSLTAEVEVSETPATPKAEVVDEPKAEAEKPAAKAKPKAAAKSPEPEAKEPEPVKEEDEPPFTPDAEEPSANDGEAPAKSAEKVTESKSLFG